MTHMSNVLNPVTGDIAGSWPPVEESQVADKNDPFVANLKDIFDGNEAGDYLTRSEIQRKLGTSKEMTMKLLHELYNDGLLDVKHVFRKNIDGRRMRIPGYRMKTVETE